MKNSIEVNRQPIPGHPEHTYGFRAWLMRKSLAGQRKPIKNFQKLRLFAALLNPHIYHRDGKPRACKVCGCTWYQACPEGCAWADQEMTVCTSCVE